MIKKVWNFISHMKLSVSAAIAISAYLLSLIAFLFSMFSKYNLFGLLIAFILLCIAGVSVLSIKLVLLFVVDNTNKE